MGRTLLLICELPGSCCGRRPPTLSWVFFCEIIAVNSENRTIHRNTVLLLEVHASFTGCTPICIAALLTDNNWVERPYLIMLLSWKECTLNVMYKVAVPVLWAWLPPLRSSDDYLVTYWVRSFASVCSTKGRQHTVRGRPAASFYRDRQRCINVWTH